MRLPWKKARVDAFPAAARKRMPRSARFRMPLFARLPELAGKMDGAKKAAGKEKKAKGKKTSERKKE